MDQDDGQDPPHRGKGKDKRGKGFESLRHALVGNIGGRLFQMGLLLFSTTVMARLLGVEGLGVVAVTVAAVRIVTLPIIEGAATLSEREIAGAIGTGDGPAARAGVVFGFRASVLFLPPALMALYLMITGSAFVTTGLMVASAALLAANIATGIVRGILRGEGHTVMTLLPMNAIGAVTPVVYLLWHGFGPGLDPVSVLWIQAGVQVLMLPFWRILVLRNWPGEFVGAQTGAIPRGWIQESMQFALVGFLTVALAEAGSLFLGWFSTAEQAGFFRIATRVQLLAMFLATAARTGFGPRIAMLWRMGRIEELAAASRRIALLAIVFSLATLVGFALLGQVLLVMAFGSEFAGAWLPSMIMCVSALVASVGPVSGRLLKMAGFQLWVTVGSIIALATALGLNLWLTEPLGAVGAAVANLGAIFVSRALYMLMVRRQMGFWPLPDRRTLGEILDRMPWRMKKS